MSKKSPDQVDKMILEDVRSQRNILNRLDREREFHQKRLNELLDQFDCEHEAVYSTSQKDKCARCGYEWVR